MHSLEMVVVWELLESSTAVEAVGSVLVTGHGGNVVVAGKEGSGSGSWMGDCSMLRGGRSGWAVFEGGLGSMGTERGLLLRVDGNWRRVN